MVDVNELDIFWQEFFRDVKLSCVYLGYENFDDVLRITIVQ